MSRCCSARTKGTGSYSRCCSQSHTRTRHLKCTSSPIAIWCLASSLTTPISSTWRLEEFIYRSWRLHGILFWISWRSYLNSNCSFRTPSLFQRRSSKSTICGRQSWRWHSPTTARRAWCSRTTWSLKTATTPSCSSTRLSSHWNVSVQLSNRLVKAKFSISAKYWQF